MRNYLTTDFDFNNDELIGLFDELPFWSAPFGIKLLDHIKLKRNITALDIGFGAGFPLTEIAERLGNSSKVYGIDPWEAAVKRAEKRIAHYGITNIEIIKGKAEDMPLPDKSVDLISSNNGLNNVSDLDKALAECARVIKTGGQFVQTFNLNETMMAFYDVMANVLEEHGLKDALVKMHEHIYVKRKPLDEYVAKIEQQGFEIKQIYKAQFEYKFIDGTAFLNYHFFRLAFMDAWKSIVDEKDQESVFEAIEARMNENASKQGNFKVAIPFVVVDAFKL